MKNERRVKGTAGESWNRRLARDRSRFQIALALSLCFHAFILSLQFGAAGYGLPGLAWPWAERRVQAPSLTVRLADVPRAPTPVPPAVVPRVIVKAKPLKPAQPSRAGKGFEVRPPTVARAVPAAKPRSRPRVETDEPAPAGETQAREREIRPQPQPEILAQSDAEEESFNVPPPVPVEPEPQRAPETVARKQAEEPPPVWQEPDPAQEEKRKAEQARAQAEEAAKLQAEAAARRRADEDARERALALQRELEAQKQEEARRLEEAKRLEESRRQALALEARRQAEQAERQKAQEAARQRALAQQKEQEASRLEEARRIEEARKQEEARRLEEEERTRQAVAERRKQQERKQEEARRLAREAEARKRAEEAARRPTADDGTPAAASPAPGALSGRDLAAKALDQARTPGALTEPPRPPSPPAQPASADSSRRRSILGAERDVVLRMYADNWRSKIERNAPINFPSWAWRRARDYPVVTVAIRKDGSLEDIIIHRSSGLRALDDAVRRIVQFYAPYSAFPPVLARQYDVIEIRRVWYFEETLRIREEL